MTTTIDTMLSPLELKMRSQFESWLSTVVAQPELHMRFANTLSMLEHIGSVKIACTQSSMDIHEEVLQHLAEETRHAQYMKRIARKISGIEESTYQDPYILAGASARIYFAKLDVVVRQFVHREIPLHQQSLAAYTLVTWLIEQRAMWLYPIYQKQLESNVKGISVRTIINEETGHLEEMEEGLKRLGLTDHSGLADLVHLEEQLFNRLAQAFMKAG